MKKIMNVEKEKPFKPSQDVEETIARLIKENSQLKEQLELQQKQYTEQKEKTKQIEESLLNLSMNIRAEKVKQKSKGDKMSRAKATICANKAMDAAEATPPILYSQEDCQGFIEQTVKRAGGTMKDYRGSNDMFRNACSTIVPLKGAKLEPGMVLFIVEKDGEEPPQYKADGLGNASHVGWYTGGRYEVVHSGATKGKGRRKHIEEWLDARRMAKGDRLWWDCCPPRGDNYGRIYKIAARAECISKNGTIKDCGILCPHKRWRERNPF